MVCFPSRLGWLIMEQFSTTARASETLSSGIDCLRIATIVVLLTMRELSCMMVGTQSGLWTAGLQGFMYLEICRVQGQGGGLFALAFAGSCSARKPCEN